MIWGPRLYGGSIGITAKKMETTIEGLGLKVEGLGLGLGPTVDGGNLASLMIPKTLK